MEQQERELIFEMMKGDMRLRRLYRRHEDYENKLGRLSGRIFLTVDEQMEEQRLKREKLHGVDQMMKILTEENVL